MLRQRVGIEEGQPKEVFSAARAKGSEYPSVLVYGFGDAFGSNAIERLLSGETPFPDEPDSALPLQYFINRLYVAVTRSQRRLVIVDSDEGLIRLWRFAQELGLENAILGRIKNGPSIWGEHIEQMSPGTHEDDTEGGEAPEERAIERAKAMRRMPRP